MLLVTAEGIPGIPRESLLYHNQSTYPSEGVVAYANAKAWWFDDKVILVGGHVHAACLSEQMNIFVFDTTTHEWLHDYDVINPASSRIGHTLVGMKEKAFVFGGESILNDSLALKPSVFQDFWQIKIADKAIVVSEVTAHSKEDYPRARSWHSCTSIVLAAESPEDLSSTGMLLVGGIGAKEELLDDVWIFLEKTSPTTFAAAENVEEKVTSPSSAGQWSQVIATGESPLPLAYHTCTSVKDGSAVVLLGGRNEKGFSHGIYVFSLQPATWSSLKEDVVGWAKRCWHSSLCMSLCINKQTGKVCAPTEDECEEIVMEDRLVIFGGRQEYGMSKPHTFCVLDFDTGDMEEVNGSVMDSASWLGQGTCTNTEKKLLYCFGGYNGNGMPQGSALCMNFHPVQSKKIVADSFDEASRSTDVVVLEFPHGEMYTGEIKENMRHGRGSCTFENGSTYEGGWVDDLMSGFGNLRLTSGEKYTGEFQNNLRHGQGVLEYSVDKPNKAPTPVKYDGSWSNDVPEGNGTCWYSDGSVLFGVWKAGHCNTGTLKEYMENGLLSVYEGEFLSANIRHGYGISTTVGYPKIGERYEGNWTDGKRHGKGKLILSTGVVYEGDWKNGKKNGFAIYKDARTREIYQGKFVADVRCGKGTCEYASGDRYEGEWRNNKPHGRGRLVDTTGKVLEGMWTDGHYNHEA